jgi:hypothetical protein
MLETPASLSSVKRSKPRKNTKRSIAPASKDYLLDHLECAMLLSVQRQLRVTAYLINLAIESLNESVFGHHSHGNQA